MAKEFPKLQFAIIDSVVKDIYKLAYSATVAPLVVKGKVIMGISAFLVNDGFVLLAVLIVAGTVVAAVAKVSLPAAGVPVDS